MKTSLPKPLLELKGKPLFLYGLEAIAKSDAIDSIILVAHEDFISEFEKIIKKFSVQKVTKIVSGGLTRRESVYNGLSVTDKDTDVVLIHDGARPLIETETVDGVIAQCSEHDAIVVGVPVKSTIKKINTKSMVVKETLKRDEIWEIQTPQVFKKDVLLKAHETGKGSDPSDDAVLVEKIGVAVKIFEGSPKNLKVTTSEDIPVAENLLAMATAG